jgi:hypothetical protein
LTKRTRKDQAKALLADEATFKLRVADLLEVWIKRNVASPLVPATLFMPVARAITMLTLKMQKNLLDQGTVNLNNRKDVTLLELEGALLARLRAVLVKRVLGRGKDYPRGEVVAAYAEGGAEGFARDVHGVLGECCDLAVRGFGASDSAEDASSAAASSSSSSSATRNATGKHPEVLQLASLAIIYMCRVLRGTSADGKTKNTDEASWGLLQEASAKQLLTETLLHDFIDRKSTRLTEDFFATLLTRLAPVVGGTLVGDLAELIERSHTDIAAEKVKQADKAARAQTVEDARQAARAAGASKKAAEKAAKKAGLAADAKVAARMNSAKANASKRKGTDEGDGGAAWRCRSQFQRGACVRLATAAVRSGAARGHESALVSALSAAVADVEGAGAAGVKVRSDLVLALVDLSEALASHAMANKAGKNAALGRDDAARLAAAAATLGRVVKTARGLKKRGHALKRVDKVQKKARKRAAEAAAAAAAAAKPEEVATGANKKKKRRRKTATAKN